MEEKEIVIDNSFDYSNVIATIDNVSILVKYCDQIANQFLNIIKADEERNERIKYEFKNFKYRKTYSETLEISISEKSFNRVSYKTYELFKKAISENKIKNLRELKITLNLDFFRGTYDNQNRHDNSFEISFEPYKITFIRKSNYKDDEMDDIENGINEVLKSFPTINTIFCTKE